MRLLVADGVEKVQSRPCSTAIEDCNCLCERSAARLLSVRVPEEWRRQDDVGRRGGDLG